jgi:hypothetical protein
MPNLYADTQLHWLIIAINIQKLGGHRVVDLRSTKEALSQKLTYFLKICHHTFQDLILLSGTTFLHLTSSHSRHVGRCSDF